MTVNQRRCAEAHVDAPPPRSAPPIRSVDYREPPEAPRRAASLLRGGAAFGAIVVIAVVCVWVYFWSTNPLAAPRAPLDSGSVVLLVSQPGMSVAMAARVRHDTDTTTSYTYDISAELGQTAASGDEVPFSLALTGTAMPEFSYPSGEKRELRNGCPALSVYAIASQISCAKGAIDSYGTAGGNTSGLVVDGFLVKRGTTWTESITVYSPGQVERTNGARTYFRLPQIGTAALPESFRDDVAIDLLGRGAQRWTPAVFGVGVSYRALDPTERIESVAPETTNLGGLEWLTTTATSISATGSVVSTAVESQLQARLLAGGALIGVLGGLVPVAIGFAWRRNSSPSSGAR